MFAERQVVENWLKIFDSFNKNELTVVTVKDGLVESI